MINSRKIELLSPAKNVECGIEAINHGADAVYIGASRFGARAAAGNSLEDLERLVNYAHLYHARVYVTLNTILKDSELSDAEKLIWQLYRVGVDALIVQDFALLSLHLPPIPLHASTQMDNRTAEKVRFLKELGYKQAVLARELSLAQIRTIHQEVPDMPLEVFVHGALCVSYSGQCYASQYCFNRSANRGECAQFCRLPFDLLDASGRVMQHEKHLLSLKDMNRSDYLEQMLDAGVSSFKIEGRLKDQGYVKNVTAYYRKRLDAIFKRRPEFIRSSSGTEMLTFHPKLEKSFNRGFTDYFLEERKQDICSMHTPKAMGEEMGYVKEIRGNCLIVSGTHHFNNGDGVCYVDETGRLQGFRVNRVDQNKIYPLERLQIRPKTILYRNFDQEFERLLTKPSSTRKIHVEMSLTEIPDGFLLTMSDEDSRRVALPLRREKELARSPQTENLKTQLSKLGNTPFVADTVEVQLSQNYFIPSSELAEARRALVDKMLQARKICYAQELGGNISSKTSPYYGGMHLSYLANAMNERSVSFYLQHGASAVEPAFEKQLVKNAPVMFCKHCIRYMMGWCPSKQKGKSPWKEPYFLRSKDGKVFRLEFDCKYCQMKVYAAE